ncbi:transposase [Gloeobacter kilaueensis]|uniref:transposase n=1 Tax=Gloeobacter kilaueensis TaxID=1416614 RepID=UPI001FE06508|nr:transposase [Gloeobacter kilaueensis]
MVKRQNPEHKQSKSNDLETLKLAEQEGLVHIKYLDESGFSLPSVIGYTWAEVGKQKRIEQPNRRGKRISVLGIYAPGEAFNYGVSLGSIKNDVYIELMDWEAKRAAERLAETGQITVIVQDNYSVHKHWRVKERWPVWERQGLYVFFLPVCCPEMNRIEEEWHQVKAHHMKCRSFEMEYELAEAVIEAIDERYLGKGLQCERYLFN